MTMALIGRRPEEAQRLLKAAGVPSCRVEYCLPPEDKRKPEDEMRVLRVKHHDGETVVLTVSPFETTVCTNISGKEE